MVKKIRHLYGISRSVITGWDEEKKIPTDVDQVFYFGDVEYPIVTANLIDAYQIYQEELEFMSDKDLVELTAFDINVSDKEWDSLKCKERLAFDDYSMFETKAPFSILASEFVYQGEYDSSISFIAEEMLRVQSEFFNMHMICKRAGINYSTYRGFKNNNQNFSIQKIYSLLECMSQVGNECLSWNNNKNPFKVDKNIN